MVAHPQNLFAVANSPFHDPHQNPLPDANDIEQEAASGIELNSFEENSPHTPPPHIKRDIKRLRNIMIGLLLAGLTLGCIVAIGVAFFMKRTGLADPPNGNQGQIYERLNTDARDRDGGYIKPGYSSTSKG